MTKVKLYAPKEYCLLTPKAKKEICNGCGTKGLGGWIVPDTLYGLSIEEACNIHDFMYHIGKTIKDKEKADRVFLNNMLRIIDSVNYSWWKRWLRVLRQKRAFKYYEAVSIFGGPAFWHNKED